MPRRSRHLRAGDVEALGPERAVTAIREALRGGLDPEASLPRSVIDVDHGQLLLMPAQTRGYVGVKVATIAPANPARGRPRIQGLYALHDADTLELVALLDGTALTTLRTPAVSVAAGLTRLRRLAAAGPAGLRVVVFGAGPQGESHAATLRAHVPVCRLTVVTRHTGPPPAWADERLTHDDPSVTERVRAAHVVVAATTARASLFDGALVRDDALVIAVGSHEPDARELDGALLSRATVVVETREVAAREAGDVILAVRESHLTLEALVPLAEHVRADGADPGSAAYDRPLVVKTSGMGWEDLVVAVAVYEKAR